VKPADTIDAPILFWDTAGRYGFLSNCRCAKDRLAGQSIL
jgi:hypothetical protein